MAKPTNLTFYVPGSTGIEKVDRYTDNVAAYLDRVAKSYPEGTSAVYFTGTGTHQYRKHYKDWRLERQTIGP